MKNWYVVNTRPRWEKKISTFLDNKGFEYYCPLNKVTKQWSDRKKIVNEPLFKGYIFVKLEEAEKFKILDIDGILNFIYWIGKPAIVRDSEIENIRKYLCEFEDVEIGEIKLEKGQEVIIKQGVLMDYKGIILELNNNKAWVRINSMGIVLSAEFKKERLSPVI
jgi:transcription antitermination factor NusG